MEADAKATQSLFAAGVVTIPAPWPVCRGVLARLQSQCAEYGHVPCYDQRHNALRNLVFPSTHAIRPMLTRVCPIQWPARGNFGSQRPSSGDVGLHREGDAELTLPSDAKAVGHRPLPKNPSSSRCFSFNNGRQASICPDGTGSHQTLLTAPRQAADPPHAASVGTSSACACSLANIASLTASVSSIRSARASGMLRKGEWLESSVMVRIGVWSSIARCTSCR